MNSSRAWQHLNRPELGLVNGISATLQDLQTTKPGAFTNLRNAHALILASDYSGHHKGAPFACYSFLIADLNSISRWKHLRGELRSAILPDGRRMAYKTLNDSMRIRALAPFLASANCLSGCLFNVVMERRVRTDLERGGNVEELGEGLQELARWKPRVLARALTIAHLGAVLVAGLSSPMQDIQWFTDEDEIVANDEILKSMCKLVAHVTSCYMPHDLGHLRFGCTRSDDGSRSIEDLVAIADLAAGAVCEIAPLMCGMGKISDFSSLVREAWVSAKACEVMDWIVANTYCLKKVIVRLFRDESGDLRIMCDSFGL